MIPRLMIPSCLLGASLLLPSCGGGAPTIEASSDEALKASVQEVSSALDEETREEFESAMQVLLFSGSKAKNLLEWSADMQTGGLERRFKAAIDGKTAAEVIAAAQKIEREAPLTPEGGSEETRKNAEAELVVARAEREAARAARDAARAEEERREAEAEAAAAADREAYISEFVSLYEVEASYRKSLLDGRVAGILFKLRNTGNRTLETVEVTVYFRDASGATIAEEEFRPVSTGSLLGGGKPLKPGYVWQMERGKFYAAKSVPSEWKEGSIEARVTEILFAEVEEAPPRPGDLVAETGSPSAEDVAEPERLRAARYIEQGLELYEAEASYRDSMLDGRVPGVLFKLKNTGEQTLSRVEVTFYFRDASGGIIAEESFHPVSTGSLLGGGKPLKPGYVWQMERGKFYAAKSVPSEWKEGSIEARVTEILFAED